MATTYLCVPLKKSWDVDLVKPLKAFISSTYQAGQGNTSEGDTSHNVNALTDFNKLRQNVIAKSVDKNESSLDIFYRYYDQLVAIDSKFPIMENQIRINFKWQDAFDKDSRFSGKKTLSIASGSFEHACILFNIAALQSHVGDAQNLSTDEGLKLAAKLFQQSSGIFNYLKSIISSVTSDPTNDLNPDTLNALSALMLAQGQDCFVRKAMNDKMKPAIVAKLSMQCSDLYSDAQKLIGLESIRSQWPKDWLQNVTGKHSAFHSIAEYYQSQVSKDAKEFGQEVAYLRHARDLMGTVDSRGGSNISFLEIQKKIMQSLSTSEKDNNQIYHSPVPEVAALPPIGRAVVAKSMPLMTPLSGAQFKDLFEHIVPLSVYSAMAAFENNRAVIINHEIGRLREATQYLNGILASLNLPAAIEDLSSDGNVPHSVLEKAATLRELGGIEKLNRLINELPVLLDRNKEILNECEKKLTEEETCDAQLKLQYSERWKRTPSVTLTQPLRAEAAKYRSIITNAINADKIVRDRYAVHKDSIELLCKTEVDINANLPLADPVAAMQGLPAVNQIRTLMESVESIKTERDTIESQLKEPLTDLSVKLMISLKQDGAVNESELPRDHLERIYGPLRDQITDSVRRQEVLLQEIQVVNAQFTEAKSLYQNKSSANREEKLKDLAAAYDSYVELKGNLEEGTKVGCKW